jgi:hypothetical protein
MAEILDALSLDEDHQAQMAAFIVPEVGQSYERRVLAIS